MTYSTDIIDVPQRAPVEGGMDAVTRAEIDIQIETALRHPRSIERVTRDIHTLVTYTREAAEECIFSLPRGGKPIVGPSIRLAEILFSQWGNCTGGSRVIDTNRQEGWIEAEGVFHDLQKNAKTVRRVRRSIKDKHGKVYSDDMIVVTGNAAGAIAFRNAVLAGVPRAVWGQAYAAAEQAMRGETRTLTERREGAIKAMSQFGLTADEVFAIVGVAGEREVNEDELMQIRGLYNALRDGSIEAETLRDGIQAPDTPAASTAAPSKPTEAASKAKASKAKAKADPAPQAAPEPPKEEAAAPDPDEAKGQAEPPADAAPALAEDPTEPPEQTADDAQAAQEPAPETDWNAFARQVMNEYKASEENADIVVRFYGTKIAQMKQEAPDLFIEMDDACGNEISAHMG